MNAIALRLVAGLLFHSRKWMQVLEREVESTVSILGFSFPWLWLVTVALISQHSVYCLVHKWCFRGGWKWVIAWCGSRFLLKFWLGSSSKFSLPWVTSYRSNHSDRKRLCCRSWCWRPLTWLPSVSRQAIACNSKSNLLLRVTMNLQRQWPHLPLPHMGWGSGCSKLKWTESLPASFDRFRGALQLVQNTGGVWVWNSFLPEMGGPVSCEYCTWVFKCQGMIFSHKLHAAIYPIVHCNNIKVFNAHVPVVCKLILLTTELY